MKISDQVNHLTKRVGALESVDFDDAAGVARIVKLYGNVRVTTTVTASLHQYGLVATENTALSFDGIVTSKVSLVSPTLTTAFTLEAWINLTGNSPTLYNMFLGSTINATYFSITSNKIFASLSASGQKTLSGTTTLSLGSWYHYSVTYDGVTLKLYLNGVLENSLTLNLAFNSFSIDRIGIWRDNESTYTFNGKIDDVRIWNVARTQAEIQADMSVRLRGDETGLVGYWNFDEGSGTIALDKTANANNGTITGATYVGRNLALSFDGVNDYVSIPILPTLGSNGAIECWFKCAGTTANPYQMIIDKYSGLYGYSIFITNSDGKLTIRYGTGGASNIGNMDYRDNTWRHVALLNNSSGITLLINGVPIYSAATVYTDSVSLETYVGSRGASLYFFNGLIDDVRIWNVTRTQAEIQANMSKRLIGNESGLVGYWKFDEASLTQALDSTVNANHGTITGATPTREAPFQDVVSFYTPIVSESLII